jgi:hypothetical protein
MYEALNYAGFMSFDNITGSRSLQYATLVSMGYTHVVFVYSEEEFLVGDFPDDAIVAWPSLFASLRPIQLNDWIKENEEGIVIDVEDYSFTYPLTIENMIDNWQGGLALARYINSHPRGLLFWREGGFDEFGRIMSMERKVFGDAIETAGIDISVYGFTLPLSHSDYIAPHPVANMPVGLELFNRLDAEVQLELSAEIPNVLAELRNELRRHAWSEKWLIWHAEQEAREGVET